MRNGNNVSKTIIVHNNNIWQFKIAGKIVDLSKIYIEGTFHLSVKGVTEVFNAVVNIKLCSGLKVTKSIIVSRYHTIDL